MTEEQYISRAEALERSARRSQERRDLFSEYINEHTLVLPLDYQDGGELQCGVCKGICLRHYRLGDRIDIGECCKPKIEHGGCPECGEANTRFHRCEARR